MVLSSVTMAGQPRTSRTHSARKANTPTRTYAHQHTYAHAQAYGHAHEHAHGHAHGHAHEHGHAHGHAHAHGHFRGRSSASASASASALSGPPRPCPRPPSQHCRSRVLAEGGWIPDGTDGTVPCYALLCFAMLCCAVQYCIDTLRYCMYLMQFVSSIDDSFPIPAKYV
jgi:hypothetical protein